MPENTVPTIGLEFFCKVVTLKDGSKLKVQVFDTAGQEKYRSVISHYIRKSLGVLLVYDITKKASFEACQEFYQQIQQLAEPDCVILLVGNKTDLESQREVPEKDGKKYAMDNKMYFIETSVVTKSQVNEAFEQLFECIYFIYYIIVVGAESKKTVNYQSNQDYTNISPKKFILKEEKSQCC